jgi:hypothetical protein
MATNWINQGNINVRSFRCGYCEREVASDKGFYSDNAIPKHGVRGWAYLCPMCSQPNYFCGEFRSPAPVPGQNVEDVPADVHDLYVEARRCVGISAFTASVLASRKLLMNIAVSQGASEGESFIAYVEYLANNGYVPPNGKGWVDHIRKRGNEATHEIAPKSEDDAKELISFSEMLLKFIYEFPAKVPAAPSAVS